MAHSLLRKPTRNANGPNQGQANAKTQQALNANMYVASIYVGRRKVWEGRAATQEQALSKAKAEQTKYGGANSEIKVSKVKPSA